MCRSVGPGDHSKEVHAAHQEHHCPEEHPKACEHLETCFSPQLAASSNEEAATRTLVDGPKSISNHFDKKGNHGLLVCIGESFQGFLGDAGFQPSTVPVMMWIRPSALGMGA